MPDARSGLATMTNVVTNDSVCGDLIKSQDHRTSGSGQCLFGFMETWALDRFSRSDDGSKETASATHYCSSCYTTSGLGSSVFNLGLALPWCSSMLVARLGGLLVVVTRWYKKVATGAVPVIHQRTTQDVLAQAEPPLFKESRLHVRSHRPPLGRRITRIQPRHVEGGLLTDARQTSSHTPAGPCYCTIPTRRPPLLSRPPH
ncbi:hypothetical protein EDB92DRAFT_1467689 [Lactarius akahatsu]|uniref:Uncharacterized protein n=1 Tax=Lactarius akahatsu TaxID=416441 RepID=A0AAD4L9P4_9AGAM|nr:hypothetical protein EDB92DRAFT_1467689 [Lactarius akahatsu]